MAPILAAAEPAAKPPGRPPAKVAAAPAAKPATGAGSLEAAAAVEGNAYAVLYQNLAGWNADNVRELGRSFPSLSEPIALQALWLAASASETVDVGPIFTTALSSSSPVVRRQAADVLASLHPPEMRRKLLLGLLRTAGEDEALSRLIDGRAAMPFPASVRSLMEVMELIDPAQKAAVTAIALHLKNLTRANVPANAEAWRDWWRANSRQYE